MATISMKQLLESGIHFGHQTRRWNPKMARYIYGERHGIYIIDLQQTLKQLRKAYIAVRNTTANGGTVLFLGTKKQAQDCVREEAERCGMYYINNRWLGGTLTNWQTIQQRIRRLEQLEELESSGKMEQFTKKEGIKMRKERDKLDRNLHGIKKMEGLPAILFVVDSNRETIAIREAQRLKIPCVAICDTNSDPDAVTIPVPGNDDAIRALQLFCSIIADAAVEGRAQYEKSRAEEAEAQKATGSGKTEQSSALARQKEKAAVDGEESAPEAEETSTEEASSDEAPAEETEAVEASES